LSPRDPIQTAPRAALQAPGAAYWLGSDQLGRDVASRVLHGARISLMVGLISVSIAVGLGAPIGLVSGFYGGRLDALVMRVIDVLLAFPGILLALAIVSVLTPGLTNVMLAVGLSAVPTYARLVRATVLSARENLYVEAARALGGSGGGAGWARSPGARPASCPRAGGRGGRPGRGWCAPRGGRGARPCAGGRGARGGVATRRSPAATSCQQDEHPSDPQSPY